MNGFPHVLLGANDDGEDDENDGSVQVVQTVDPVIVIPALQASVGRETTQYAVKPVQQTTTHHQYSVNLLGHNNI